METFGLKQFVRRMRRGLMQFGGPRHPGFDLGDFFRRRATVYDQVRGMIGCRAGKSMSPREQAKRAERRARRRALLEAIAKEDQVNPAGSKRMRRYAKRAGFTVDAGGGKSRAPTLRECHEWHSKLFESEQLQGHRGFRIVRKLGSPLTVS